MVPALPRGPGARWALRSHASRPQPLVETPRSVRSAVGATWRPASTPTKSDSVSPRSASGRDARCPRGGWLRNRTENTAPKPVLPSAAAPPGRGEPGARWGLWTRLHKADFRKTLGKRVPRVRTRLSSSRSSYIQPPPSSQAQRSPPSLPLCTGQCVTGETLPGGEALESSGSPRGCFLSQFYLTRFTDVLQSGRAQGQLPSALAPESEETWLPASET